jgi:hypothetical protein
MALRAQRRIGPPRRAFAPLKGHVGARHGDKRCIAARVACCSAPLGKVLGCRRRRGCLIFVSVLMHRIYRWRTRRQSRHSVPGRKRCWRESNSAFHLCVPFVLIRVDRYGLAVWTIGRFPIPVIPVPVRTNGAAISFVLFPSHRFLVHGPIRARAHIRSFSTDRCASACGIDPFSKIIVSAVLAGRKRRQ